MTDNHRRPDDVHEQIAELLAVGALGGLSTDDKNHLEALRDRHGRWCAECAQLETEFGEITADLALALPPRAPRTGAWDRLIAVTGADIAAPRPIGGRTSPALPKPRRHVLPRIVTVAAAAVLVIAGGVVGYTVHGGGNSGRETAIARIVGQPGTRLVRFRTAGTTSLSVLYRPGHAAAWILGARLPAPSANRVYELWYQPTGQQRMHPAGTFSGGTISQPTTIAGPIQTLAVSVEPAGGSAQPTTKPIYLAAVRS